MTENRFWRRVLAVLAATALWMALWCPCVTATAASAGDVDGDGSLTMYDALMLYGFTSGRSTLTAAQVASADVNGNGVIDMLDTMALYMHISYGTVPDPEPSEPTVLHGIDVSYAQGRIDWAKVAASGEVDFAILRCGYGQDEPGQDDTMWDVNTAACELYGIPYGTYFFCYARTPEEAAGEAKHALRLLEGKNLSYPVFYDMEYSSWQGNLTNAQYAAIAQVFCSTLEEAGYAVGVYANLDWWRNRLTDPCFDNWYRWVAQYNETCDYTGEYQMWQYSDGGTVDGIDSNKVDLNWSYVNFAGMGMTVNDE